MSLLDTDEFKFFIYNLIYKAVSKTYMNDLVSLDFYDKLNNEAVFKLNNILKARVN